MRREEVAVEDGLLCLDINGKAEIVFNPTDLGFIERVQHLADTLNDKQSAIEARVKAAKSREIYKIARDCDREMREMLDALLGAGTCEAIFGSMNVYAYGAGLPVWLNLLTLITDRCELESVEQKRLMDEKLAQYTAKYRK